jgi:flagellum-specific peptidoglycan hydrolase FlgJ
MVIRKVGNSWEIVTLNTKPEFTRFKSLLEAWNNAVSLLNENTDYIEIIEERMK